MVKEYFETPIVKKYDVIVAGGGFAGISAALAASRQGARVLLVEREYILGGLGTAGIVTIYLPLCDGMGKQVSFGIAEELFKLSIKYGAEEMYPDAWLDGDDLEARKKQRLAVQYNPHMFALLAERLLLENGVAILYGTSVCSVAMNNKKISAVIVENKSGRTAIAVEKGVVDCTGDADIAKLSGAATTEYAPKNILAAWHYSVSVSRGLSLHQMGACDSAVEKEEDILTSRRFIGTDGTELSEMTQMAHRFILDDILKNKKRDVSYVPVTIPTIPQIRMTRRINGVYTMNEKEMHKSFDDSVGLFPDWRKRGPVYELPFTTLYGNDVQNLICAGRCISVTDDMWDITRVIPVCAVSGQAAGTAAAMTNNFTEIDIKELQMILQGNGVVMHEKEI